MTVLPPFLSIIIPAHNEEQRLPISLPKVIAFLQQRPYEAELLVVENGSTDKTWAIAQKFAEQYPSLRVLREPNSGKGLAVRRGMLAAAGSFRFICDADLSMPIEQVSRFLPPQAPSYDIAIASREIPGARRIGEPLYRHWIGRAFNRLVRLITLPGIHDTQCGFKCFTSAAAEALFSIQTINGWTFDVEVLFIAARRGHRIIEIPIDWYYDPGSRVRMVRDSLRMLSDLFLIRRNARRGLYDESFQR